VYKQKTLLKIFPIATMAVGYTVGIPADEYTAKLTAHSIGASKLSQ
jgi:hypothetical protein